MNFNCELFLFDNHLDISIRSTKKQTLKISDAKLYTRNDFYIINIMPYRIEVGTIEPAKLHVPFPFDGDFNCISFVVSSITDKKIYMVEIPFTQVPIYKKIN